MAFDYPNSPTEGQVFSPSGGPTYEYSAGRWIVGGLPGGGDLSGAVNVKDYGATGNGVADDTAALLAAVAAGMAQDKTVYAPAGIYCFNQQLLFDYGSPGLSEGSKCGLIGDGPSLTHFLWKGVATADAAIKMKGTTAIDLSPIGGFTIRPDTPSLRATTGLHLEMRSYTYVDRVYVLEMAVGIKLKDVILSTLNQCVTNWGLVGIETQDGTRSSCNAVCLNDCTVVSNLTVGWKFKNGTYVIRGGEVGFNGTTLDTAGEGGIIYTGAVATQLGQQDIPLLIDGVYIEGNAGKADIHIIQDTTTHRIYSLKGVIFGRLGTKFATNCIRVECNSNFDAHLAVDACAFNYDPGSYTPNAARPYIARTGTGSGRLMYDLRPSTVFYSATEAPGFQVNFMGQQASMVWQPIGNPGFQALSVAGAVEWVGVRGTTTGGPSVEALSTGTNTNLKLVPKGTGTVNIPIANIQAFADDVAASAGGIAIGGFYRTASALKIRVA